MANGKQLCMLLSFGLRLKIYKDYKNYEFSMANGKQLCMLLSFGLRLKIYKDYKMR